MRAVACEFSRKLSKYEWIAFQRLLDQAKFWEKPGYVFRDGLDGYDYTLEARVHGRYHFVMRWVPVDYPEDRAFAKLGDWISGQVKRLGVVTGSDGASVITRKGRALILGK